jgi:hypothetical protein
MQHYKVPNDPNPHCIDPAFAYMLPAGSIAITDDEAEALRPKPPEPTAKDLLEKLDAENALTQRNLRETVMLMAEAFKTVTNGQVDLTTIPGVAKVYEVEAQAAALREQL